MRHLPVKNIEKAGLLIMPYKAYHFLYGSTKIKNKYCSTYEWKFNWDKDKTSKIKNTKHTNKNF